MRFLIPLLRNWSWLSRESRGLVVRCAANTQLSPSQTRNGLTASYYVILSIGDCCAPWVWGVWRAMVWVGVARGEWMGERRIEWWVGDKGRGEFRAEIFRYFAGALQFNICEILRL